MATIDITSLLSTSKPTIKIGEHVYEVNDDLETLFKMEAMGKEEGDAKQIVEVLKLLLGEDGYKRVEKEHEGTTTRLVNLTVLLNAAISAATGQSFEELQAARFQEQAETV